MLYDSDSSSVIHEFAHIQHVLEVRAMTSTPHDGSGGSPEQALFADCVDLYERTAAEVTYEWPSGRIGPYWARRFMRKIKTDHEETTPSRIVESVSEMVCKPAPQGFGIIEQAGRLDLSLELLVLDESTPYHHLFAPDVVDAAADRMDVYLARQHTVVADGPTLRSLQERVRAFRDERDWAQFHTPKDLAAAIAIEAGELQELFLWQDRDAQRATLESRSEAVRHEIADVLILTLAFAEITGIDLGAAVEEKLRVNATKYPVAHAKGLSLKYSDLPGDRG